VVIDDEKAAAGCLGLIQAAFSEDLAGFSASTKRVPSPSGETGTEFDVDIRGRSAKARVVPTPFYKRGAARKS